MKKIVLNVFVIASVAMASIACKSDKKNETQTKTPQEVAKKSEGAQKFVVNTDQSTIKWMGSKPTGEHIGTIAIKSGEFFIKDGTMEGGNILIDMTSIQVNDADMPDDKKKGLEAHLKGTAEGKENDFFNTTNYPEATFEVTGLTGEGKKMLLEGNLTMKDKTHNVSFPIEVSWASDGSVMKLTSEPFIIDRTKWGVNYGSKTVFGNLGDNWISNDIRLTIMLKATQA